MDADSEAKVKEYINHNEETQWLWKLAETIADLAWIEKETKEGFLGKWLKNDENLLLYAELTMKTEKLSVLGIGGSKHTVEHMLSINGLNVNQDKILFYSDVDSASLERYLYRLGDVTKSNYLIAFGVLNLV